MKGLTEKGNKINADKEVGNMDQHQQLPIDQNVLEEEDHGHAPLVTELVDEVLDNLNDIVRLVLLIVVDEIDSLNKQCLLEEDIESDGNEAEEDGSD